MKLKISKIRFFNMIEVCLALGVMAVGVIGAVAILPSAMKTSEIASNDLYIADAVNMLFAQIDQEAARIQLQYDEDYRKIGEKYDAEIDAAGGDTEKQQELAEKKIEEQKKFMEEAYSDFENLFASSTQHGYDNVCTGIWSGDTFKRGTLFTSSVDGASGDASEVQVRFQPLGGSYLGIVSLYHIPEGRTVNEPTFPSDTSYVDGLSSSVKQSGVQPFFRAMVRIYSTPVAHDPENGSESNKSDMIREIKRQPAEWEVVDYEVDGKPQKGLFKLQSTKAEAISMTSREEAHWRRVYMEISYPVNVPIARRTKKTFIKEYYLMD